MNEVLFAVTLILGIYTYFIFGAVSYRVMNYFANSDIEETKAVIICFWIVIVPIVASLWFLGYVAGE